MKRVRELLGAGKAAEAAQRCRTLLPGEAASGETLGLMGEIEYRAGNTGAAAQWLEKALAADKRHARSHWVLGNISQDQGMLDRAISSYRRALRADANLAEAQNDLGTAYFAKGWHREAEQCYRRALELQPENVAAMENLAATLRAQGRLGEARAAFVRTLKLRVTAALHRLLRRRSASGAAPVPVDAQTRDQALAAAKDLFTAGKLAEAQARLRGLLAEKPDEAQAHHWLGRVLAADTKRAEAIGHFERAIALHSSSPEFYISLGNALTDERKYEDALRNYQAALLLDPGSAAAIANIARVLHERGHFRESEEVLRLSLASDPDVAAVHSNYAGTLLALGKYADAEAAARKALALGPRAPHTLLMLANALIGQGRVDEARAIVGECEATEPNNARVVQWLGQFQLVFREDLQLGRTYLERAKALDPANPDIRISLARVLLFCEQFKEGWDEYEWRRQESVRASVYKEFPYPDWNGEPLEGKVIAVNGEQGLGDEIMFASCLADVAALASRSVLYCHRRLEPLFRRSFPSIEVIGGSHRTAEGDPFPILEGIDYQVAAGSLPRFFRRSAAEFPDHRGYLKADEQKIQKWRKRLAALGTGLKAGISWKGGTPLSDEPRRTLTLEKLEPVLKLRGVHWVSLQHGDCVAEREQALARSGIRLHHWQEAIEDLDELAALLCALDLRISVCNTQVHLSGALGKEIWVVAPVYPDWRYAISRPTMLWYPATRMFRQRTSGDWSAPLADVKRTLENRLQGS